MDKPAGIMSVSKPKNAVIQTRTRRGFFRTLLLWFLLISLVPLAAISLINYLRTYETLQDKAKSELMIGAENKANQIQSFFQNALTVLLTKARGETTVSMAKDFRRSYQVVGIGLSEFVKSPEWDLLSEKYGEDIEFLISSHGYTDFILIDYDGNVLYTDRQADDLGTNLFTGKYADTQFGKACREAFEKEISLFSDLEKYAPSADAPLSFLVSLIYDENREKIGLAAIQVSKAAIDRIMQERSGLGQEGEAYLVGKDLRIRSDSRTDDETAAIDSPVKTEQALLWRERRVESESPLIDEKGAVSIYTGRRGSKVFGLYHPIEIAGVPMALITEIPESQALAAATTQRNTALLLVTLTAILVLILASIAAKTITRPIVSLSDWAKRVAAGDLSIVKITTPANEIGVLNESFGKAVASLLKAESERERNSWLNTGQSELDDHMRGDQSLEELCKNIITYIANYLQAQVGVFYVNDGEGTFKLTGGYALKSDKDFSGEFKMGEGLMGQAALEKEVKIIREVPEDYITVMSSLGEKTPKNIMVIPFIYNETVMGVVEIGSFEGFTELQITFLNQISERIAVATNSAMARKRLQGMFEEAQLQAEEMEAQHEELRVANEELEEKTRSLQASEEELREMTEKLHGQKAELQKELGFEQQQLVALFDGIDDVVYVSDPETYELLYVNTTFMKTWGEDVIGKKCYGVMRGQDTPCSFCNNDRIFGENVESAYVWESRNEVTQRWFRHSDKAIRWPDGRMVRFELAVDITDYKHQGAELPAVKEGE